MAPPTGTGPARCTPFGSRYAEQPTTVSVGPYSFISRTAGACPLPPERGLRRERVGADHQRAGGGARLVRRDQRRQQGQVGGGDLDETEPRLLPQRGRQRLYRVLLGQQVHGAAGEEREQVGDGQVHRHRREHGRAVSRVRSVEGHPPVDVVHHAPVVHGHALGAPGAPRRVDDVAQVLARHAGLRRVRPLRRDPLPRRVDGQDVGAGGNRQAVQQPRLREHHPHGAVAHHVASAVRGVAGIHGHVRAARLHHPQDADHQLQPALQADPHPGLRPDAGAHQVVGQAVGPRVQLAVGQRRVPGDHGHVVRRPPRLRLEQLVDAQVRGIRHVRAVPLLHHAPPLRRVQQFQPRHAHLRIVRHLLQHAGQLCQHTRGGARVEERGTVEQPARQPLPMVHEIQGQVVLGGRGRAGRGDGPQPPQAQPLPRRGLEREEHLKDGADGGAALRPQRVHQPIEGELLVRVRVQHRLAHPGHQRAEGRVVTQAGAKRQQVHEDADHTLRLRPRPSGHRRAHHHVVLPRPAAEDGLKGGQQRHEQRGALRPRVRPELCGRLRGERERLRRALVPRGGRAGAVGGQLQQRRGARQPLAPVAQVLLQHGAGQPLPLPGRVVRVLHGERGQDGIAPLHRRGVELRQLAHQDLL